MDLSNNPSVVAALVATAVTLFTVIAVHRLTLWRDLRSRRVQASAKFRAAIHSAIVNVPPVSEHWGNAVTPALSNATASIGLAVAEFAPHTGYRKQVIVQEFDLLKRHCVVELPKALSHAEILYGGGSSAAKEAKEQFYIHIQKLLSFADET